jgi:hypothetical protein
MAHYGALSRMATHRSQQHGDRGSVIDTQQVARLLAYPSANAVRQAHRRGSLPVPLFRVGTRRRLFARLEDVENLLREGLQQAHPPAPKGASTTEEVS